MGPSWGNIHFLRDKQGGQLCPSCVYCLTISRFDSSIYSRFTSRLCRQSINFIVLANWLTAYDIVYERVANLRTTVRVRISSAAYFFFFFFYCHAAYSRSGPKRLQQKTTYENLLNYFTLLENSWNFVASLVAHQIWNFLVRTPHYSLQPKTCPISGCPSSIVLAMGTTAGQMTLKGRETYYVVFLMEHHLGFRNEFCLWCIFDLSGLMRMSPSSDSVEGCGSWNQNIIPKYRYQLMFTWEG